MFYLMRAPGISSLVVTLSAFAGCLILEDSRALRADIQDPPMIKQDPVRKLGRGLSNVAFGLTEVFSSIEQVNADDGNAASRSYGVVRGIQRTLVRLGVGVYEVITFPFPTMKGSYEPVLKRPIPWVQGGYEEFPPELGFETRFDYCRVQSSSSRMP